MDARVFAERCAEKVAEYKQAAAGLLPLIDTLPPAHPDRVPLREAEAMLREAAVEVSQLGGALNVYSAPNFYENLPPSRATEDGGAHARNVLEQVFSE
jgi:hypothetical protein